MDNGVGSHLVSDILRPLPRRTDLALGKAEPTTAVDMSDQDASTATTADADDLGEDVDDEVLQIELS